MSVSKFVQEHKWSILAVAGATGLAMAYFSNRKEQEVVKEVVKATERTMHDLDTNLDGEITKEELAKGAGIPLADAQAVVEMLDANGDGTIQREELTKATLAWKQSSGKNSFFQKLFGRQTPTSKELLN